MAGERVLIISDNPKSIEFLLTDVLLPHGYLVQIAANGNDGLSAIQEQQPDLLLLDSHLKGLTNAEMLEQLSILTARPIVVLASAGAEAQALDAIRRGARDALLLPSSVKDAIAVIARALFRERLDSERDWLVRHVAHANENLERTLEHVQTLHAAGRVISSSLNLGDVLVAVVQSAITITHADDGYLLLRDLEQDELFLRVSQNKTETRTEDLGFPVDDSIARQVVCSGEPISLSSPGQSPIQPSFGLRPGSGSVGVRSLVNVPLLDAGQVIAVLGVANVSSDRIFTKNDVTSLTALADFATIAIKNAESFEETAQALRSVRAEVAAAQHRTETIRQNASDGIYTVDKDLRFTSANAAMERITGWRESELLGQRFDKVLSPQGEGDAQRAEETVPGRALRQGAPVSATPGTILGKDGHPIAVIGMAHPLISGGASSSQVLGLMREVTWETQSDHVDQARPRATYDGQTPIPAVDTLIKHTLQALEPERISATDDCHPVTLRPIISQVVSQLQGVTSAGLFQITLAPDLPFAIGDERQIELALHHLVHNAVLMGHPAHPVEISAQTCKDSIVVTVASTPQDNEHNDHTYAHAAYDQTRCKADLLSQHITPEIRLYIASKLIQAQGGRVWTENRTETSTCYHFSLPRIEGQHVAQALAD